MMTVDQTNADDLPRVHDLCAKLGVRHGVERLAPAFPPQKPLAREQWREILDSLQSLGVECSDPLSAVAADQRRQGIGCTAGCFALAITADLRVLPCVRIRYSVGQIGKASLAEIWSESEALRQLRDRSLLGGHCGKCHIRDHCGGCRAAAFYAGSGLMGEDPQCWVPQRT